MDGVSAAASVVSLVTIAGQLIQSIKAVYEFWSSVKGVPTRLAWLVEDLQFLQQTLKQVEQYAIQDPSVGENKNCRQALEMCALHVANLEELITPLQSLLGERKKVVLWKSVKAVFCVKKVELYRKYLEEAKATVLLACTILNRFAALSTRIALCLKLINLRESILKIESSVAKLLAGQSSAMDTTADNHTSVLSAISSLQNDIQMTVASSASKTSDTLASLIKTSLEDTISPILERKLEEYFLGSGLTHFKRLELISVRERAEGSEVRVCMEDPFMFPRVSRLRNQFASTASSRRHVLWKRFPTPFGHILLYYHVNSRNWTSGGLYDGPRIFEYGFAFVPRPQLSRWATLITGIWESVPSCFLLGPAIQFRPIVSSDSLIFRACRAGDVDMMRSHFQRSLASPQAVNEKGEDLLQHALEAPAHVRFETCKFLLDAGCQPATSIEGYNPLDKVMSVWTPADLEADLTDPAAALDCDLEIMRLLVEFGKLEQMNYRKLIMGLTIRSLIGLPYDPPALDYLCKQPFFVFSLSTFITSLTSENGRMGSDFEASELCSCLRAVLACGGDELAPLGSEINTLMIAALVKLITMETFNDLEEQQAGFNTAVLVLSLSLKYGMKPNYQLLDGGYLETASRLADSDPKFTAVAWRRALELNGWALPDHGFGNQNRNEIDVSEATPDQKDIKVGDVLKDNEDLQRVPGAWIKEDPKPGIQTQVLRRFRSIPDDFNGIIRDRYWDSRLYSKLGIS